MRKLDWANKNAWARNEATNFGMSNRIGFSDLYCRIFRLLLPYRGEALAQLLGAEITLRDMSE